MYYTPDKNYNTEFGENETMVATVTQYPDVNSKGSFTLNWKVNPKPQTLKLRSVAP